MKMLSSMKALMVAGMVLGMSQSGMANPYYVQDLSSQFAPCHPVTQVNMVKNTYAICDKNTKDSKQASKPGFMARTMDFLAKGSFTFSLGVGVAAGVNALARHNFNPSRLDHLFAAGMASGIFFKVCKFIWK